MSNAEETVFLIRGVIASLSPGDQEAVKELADHIKSAIRRAGEPVGTLAMALVGAEAQAEAEVKP